MFLPRKIECIRRSARSYASEIAVWPGSLLAVNQSEERIGPELISRGQ
jgi:hypothetical protein